MFPKKPPFPLQSLSSVHGLPHGFGGASVGGDVGAAMERGPRDAEFKHRCYPKARDLAAFFLFRPEAPTFFFLGALGFRLGGS